LFNSIASEISGYSEHEVLNNPVDEIVRIINMDNILVDYYTKESYKNDDVLIVSKDDLFRHVSINVSNILDVNDDILGKVIVLIDMSEIKKRENGIIYLSYHDILTGLYNRTFLEIELKRLDTKRQLPFSIIMGDVNGLKMTNDVFGHEAGDVLLKKVSEILKKSCRQEDIIGRWGGDEFIILLPNTSDEEAFVVMKRIIRDFEGLNMKDSVSGLIPSVSLGYGVKKTMDDNIYETLRIAESNMYKRKMLSAESIYSSIITSMKTALFEKSNETEEHTNRLFTWCYKIGSRYNLNSDEFNDLELLCMLHDIGKIGISDVILKKPGKLSEEEWIEMKTHSDIGFRIAQATPELKKVANYILYHHERFDGLGYPIGLKAYEIPLIDRILSVVDAFDAMTNDRTYRKALNVDEAIKEIQINSGTQFDPEVAKIFIDLLK
jgi:diguanylate cyclase (GGDEF)-like protein